MNIGDRLYDRRADLFGRLVGFGPDRKIWIKYELPYDPCADPELVDPGRLRYASDVRLEQ